VSHGSPPDILMCKLLQARRRSGTATPGAVVHRHRGGDHRLFRRRLAGGPEQPARAPPPTVVVVLSAGLPAPGRALHRLVLIGIFTNGRLLTAASGDQLPAAPDAGLSADPATRLNGPGKAFSNIRPLVRERWVVKPYPRTRSGGRVELQAKAPRQATTTRRTTRGATPRWSDDPPSGGGATGCGGCGGWRSDCSHRVGSDNRGPGGKVDFNPDFNPM